MEIVITTNANQVADELARHGANILDILQGPLDRGAFRIEAGMKDFLSKPVDPDQPYATLLRGLPD